MDYSLKKCTTQSIFEEAPASEVRSHIDKLSSKQTELEKLRNSLIQLTHVVEESKVSSIIA